MNDIDKLNEIMLRGKDKIQRYHLLKATLEKYLVLDMCQNIKEREILRKMMEVIIDENKPLPV